MMDEETQRFIVALKELAPQFGYLLEDYDEDDMLTVTFEKADDEE